MLCLCHKHFVEEKSIGNVQTERRKIEKRSNEGDAEKKYGFMATAYNPVEFGKPFSKVLWTLHEMR